MNFENPHNINKQETDLAADTRQAILDLIRFKNYGGLSPKQINFQLAFVKNRIQELTNSNDPAVEELVKMINGNFGSFTNGQI